MKKTKIEITYFNNKFKLELTPRETIKFIKYIDADLIEKELLVNRYRDIMIIQVSDYKGLEGQYGQNKYWMEEDGESVLEYTFKKFFEEEVSFLFTTFSIFLKHKLNLLLNEEEKHEFEKYDEFKEVLKIDLGDFRDQYPEYYL